jgi:NADPH-dependent ferric siderophore reductase
MTTSDATALIDELHAYGPSLLAHFNAEHPDAVEIVAKAHGGSADASSAAVTAVTVDSFTIRLGGDGAPEAVVPFARPLSSITELNWRTIEVIAAAREALGVTELTSLEREAQAIHALRTYVTSVARVEQLTPHFRQITFAGGHLDTFEPGGLDQFLYVLLPPPGRGELTIDASFSWSAYEEMPEAERPVGAYYTVRAWRPAADGRPAELDMIFLLHDEGHATTWAASAQPGDPAALWGPRTGYEAPAETEWLLLAADETGLPAVSVILEHLPQGMPAHVFVELGDQADRLPLPESPDIHVTWLDRAGAPAGTTTLLADSVRAFDLPPGNLYAWGGAESRAVTAIRKYLRHERGYVREQVSMTGYWRHPSTPPGEE